MKHNDNDNDDGSVLVNQIDTFVLCVFGDYLITELIEGYVSYIWWWWWAGNWGFLFLLFISPTAQSRPIISVWVFYVFGQVDGGSKRDFWYIIKKQNDFWFGCACDNVSTHAHTFCIKYTEYKHYVLLNGQSTATLTQKMLIIQLISTFGGCIR